MTPAELALAHRLREGVEARLVVVRMLRPDSLGEPWIACETSVGADGTITVVVQDRRRERGRGDLAT